MPIALELTLTYSAGASGATAFPGPVGGAGDLRLVVWVRGLAFGAARASVVALGVDDQGRPWRFATSLPFGEVVPVAEGLLSARWPEPRVEEGMDSSDLWQQARLVGQVDDAQGNVVLAGMAVGYNGHDSVALRQVLARLLRLAQVRDAQAWWFLAGEPPPV